MVSHISSNLSREVEILLQFSTKHLWVCRVVKKCAGVEGCEVWRMSHGGVEGCEVQRMCHGSVEGCEV